MTSKQKEGILFLVLMASYLIVMPSWMFVAICGILLIIDFKIGDAYQLLYVFMISIFVNKYETNMFVAAIFFFTGAVLIYQFVQEKKQQKKEISKQIREEKAKRNKQNKKKKSK